MAVLRKVQIPKVIRFTVIFNFILYLSIANTNVEGNWISVPKVGVLASPDGSQDSRNSTESAETTIQTFLSTQSPSLTDKDAKFYIQGWRWHTLSLIRDSKRLQKYAHHIMKDTSTQSQEGLKSLNDAVNHVIDFNLRGLQRIEDDVFFPWLRKKLIHENTDQNNKKAFQYIMDGVDRDRKEVENLASKIVSEVEKVVDSESDNTAIQQAAAHLVKMSDLLSTITRSIMDREDRFLVPAVVKVVSASEQKSINNKVLRNLGLFESRRHLVGMHDAVFDEAYGNKAEEALFSEQIPSVARMMIERWRRTVYEPKAGMLDIVS